MKKHPMLEEIIQAYADCTSEDWAYASAKRNLDYRCSTPVSLGVAINTLEKAIPDGYNEFSAKLLKLLPDACLVTIAREGSVCIYVSGNVAPIEAMKADEWNYNPATNETRIWWD